MSELPASIAARLAELAGLEDGWLDGEGMSVLPDCLRRAEQLLRVLSAGPPGIFPTPTGGVSLEWREVDGATFSVEFAVFHRCVRINDDVLVSDDD